MTKKNADRVITLESDISSVQFQLESVKAELTSFIQSVNESAAKVGAEVELKHIATDGALEDVQADAAKLAERLKQLGTAMKEAMINNSKDITYSTAQFLLALLRIRYPDIQLDFVSDDINKPAEEYLDMLTTLQPYVDKFLERVDMHTD
ncbi:hypothetical protein ACP70R_037730 [Stipagrostis hirtigluma subsp. patula]